MQERAGLSPGEFGLAFLALEAGAVVGLSLGGAVCARIGSRRALRIGFVTYAAELAWAGSTIALQAALFTTANGTGVVDVAMNTQGLELERRLGRPDLSKLHAAHSAGGLAGGLGGTLAAALAAIASGLMFGRLLADGVVRRLGPARTMRASGVTAAIGVIGALIAPAALPALVGWFVVGIGIAPVAPTVMRAAGATAEGPTAVAIAAVTSIGYLGSFTGPPLIGGLASLSSLDLALGVLLLACAAITVLGAVVQRS